MMRGPSQTLAPTLRGTFFGKYSQPNTTQMDAIKHSDAASGWAGWALAHPEFGSSVNPITIRGEDYAHHTTASSPGFESPAASLRDESI